MVLVFTACQHPVAGHDHPVAPTVSPAPSEYAPAANVQALNATLRQLADNPPPVDVRHLLNSASGNAGPAVSDQQWAKLAETAQPQLRELMAEVQAVTGSRR
jgi:hypothetical protein